MPYADWLNISVIEVTYDGEDITNLVKSVKWSGTSEDVFRKLSISMINTTYGRTKRMNIEEGREIVFKNNDEVLFRGIVFSDEIDINGNQSITAYDENVYLTKNSISRKFNNKKASDILKELCNDFGIDTDTIEDTGFVISKVVFRDKTIANVVKELLDTTYKQNGRKFFITNRNGGVALTDRANNTIDFTLENAKNITDASYSKSIEDTRTKVRVIAGDIEESPLSETVTSDYEADFGTMQHIEEVDEDMTKSEVKQRAQELLAQLETIDDDASVAGLGDPRIISGVQINVEEEMTELSGQYYVTSDTHTFENGLHTMSLNISANDA